jgi:ADP-ribosyl-[dinitrogen reductase] hydrolase
MLGMAIGEALGAPFEGLTHEQIQERAGRVEGFVDPAVLQTSARSGYFQKGVYEDETQMALAAADVIIRGGAFQPDAFRDRLEELGQPIDGNSFGCFRRARRNLRTSVKKMLKGAKWDQSGVNTAGGGAASRGVPIGIWYRSDEKALIQAAIEAALVTHRDPRSVCATVAVAKGVALALEADPAKFDAAPFVKALHATCRAAEDLLAEKFAENLQKGFEPFLHQFSDALLLLTELASLDLEPAFAKIVAHATGKGSRPITLATRGFALTGVLTAFYFFLTGLDSFDDTVLDVVAEGGSSDSLGCLVGAFLGALHGAKGIPEAWRRELKNADQVELRGRILGGAPREGLKSLMLLEAALTMPAPKPPARKRKPAQRGSGPRGRPQGGRPRGPSGPRGRGGPPGRGGGGGGRGRPYGGGGRPPRGDDRGPRRGPPGRGPARGGGGGGFGRGGGDRGRGAPPPRGPFRGPPRSGPGPRPGPPRDRQGPPRRPDGGPPPRPREGT